MNTSGGSPFQPPIPVPATFDMRFDEAMGLGLLCRSLSRSPYPWFGIMPETRRISGYKEGVKDVNKVMKIKKLRCI